MSREVRYYISSLGVDPARILAAVRSRWAIENPVCTGCLICAFREDSKPREARSRGFESNDVATNGAEYLSAQSNWQEQPQQNPTRELER